MIVVRFGTVVAEKHLGRCDHFLSFFYTRNACMKASKTVCDPATVFMKMWFSKAACMGPEVNAIGPS